MATNRWQLGVMYNGGLLNGQPFYSQPNGPGTAVIPSQYSGPFLSYPIPGLTITEYIPWWSPGCGHSIKMWKVIREFDYVTNMSCALITCEICTYCQSVLEPFEEWLQPITHAIIVG
jgi:hypothetical protein